MIQFGVVMIQKFRRQLLTPAFPQTYSMDKLFHPKVFDLVKRNKPMPVQVGTFPLFRLQKDRLMGFSGQNPCLSELYFQGI